jgi:ABC-type cobalt transport system substrate-binding protein
MGLDAFERRVISILILLLAFFLLLSFMAFSFGLSLGGTDERVEETASEASGQPVSNTIILTAAVELLMFFALASTAGLVAGYLLPDILEGGSEDG